QTYEQGTSQLGNQELVGEVTDADDKWIYIDVKNRCELNDDVLLMTPKNNRRIVVEIIENKNSRAINAIPDSGHYVSIPRIEGLDDEAVKWGMLARYMR